MQDREPTDSMRAALSALMDGDQTAADQACRAWRGDAVARDHWHTYHLIGDLLRSDEHRSEPAHDAVFVARLRERLAAEPVVLAPQPPLQASPIRLRRARAWMAPAAVAAGFVVVAGALVVTRVGAPEGDAGERLARGAASGSVPAALAVASPGSVPASSAQLMPVENATLIRSRELDRYLAAHRQYASTSTPGAARGAVQNVSVTGSGR